MTRLLGEEAIVVCIDPYHSGQRARNYYSIDRTTTRRSGGEETRNGDKDRIVDNG